MTIYWPNSHTQSARRADWLRIVQLIGYCPCSSPVPFSVAPNSSFNPPAALGPQPLFAACVTGERVQYSTSKFSLAFSSWRGISAAWWIDISPWERASLLRLPWTQLWFFVYQTRKQQQFQNLWKFCNMAWKLTNSTVGPISLHDWVTTNRLSNYAHLINYWIHVCGTNFIISESQIYFAKNTGNTNFPINFKDN